jgi:hypothetical protein
MIIILLFEYYIANVINPSYQPEYNINPVEVENPTVALPNSNGSDRFRSLDEDED